MEHKAFIFDIKHAASEDGPGIRTTVFFKGCPLSCVWCQNPEGIDPRPSLSFRAELCRASACAMPCIVACPSQALRRTGHSLQVDHHLCTHCGRCLNVCPEKALEQIGYWLTVEELFYRVAIDKPFFRATGGGVTASGGECTVQMDFLHEFFKKLKVEGISTAIETNGMFNFERFNRLLLPFLDLVYFDIKLIDDQASRRYTGISNRPILDNFIRLIETTDIPVVVRIPLIPEITATEHNLQGIRRFLREHGVKHVNLLPYNPMWQDKLQHFGLKPGYYHSSFMSQQQIQQCIRFLH